MLLSFITPEDQALFTSVFKRAVREETIMSGAGARNIMVQSGLDATTLSYIWLVYIYIYIYLVCHFALTLQDACRHHTVWDPLLSRVRTSDVPLQYEASWRDTPSSTSGEY
jgi:type IV secretory pathway TrbD component